MAGVVTAAARRFHRGSALAGARLFCEAPGARLGWRRQALSGRGGGRREVLEKSRFFRRGFAFSALSYLGYEAYVFISQSAMVVHAGDQDELLDQADYLYGSGETEKLCQLLNQHKTSDNAQVLWRLARASRDLAQLSHTSAEKKRQLTYEALDYAKKALEKDPSCFSVHKWYAICISDVGDYEGIKTKIANAFVIKEHFQKAIELNPKDATSLHLMGIWCYTFAEMPWYQSKIAAVLFSTPPSSTYEEALRYFQKAEDVEPNFYSKNLLFLGKTYMKLNNRKLALLWLTKAKERLSHTEEDKQVQKEALELLNSM
ncbi:regulator of microtubule dynamics protein 1 isoform X2 [Elgaria multicarinata webbii]|uniref:regulator of microtubule dynamics protein 1 isoform X2 n=1 Tax=Elgaria multicarinata webbii TaxID=159646 RepID=UPI002FCD3E2D